MNKKSRFILLAAMTMAIGACGTDEVVEPPTDTNTEQETDNNQETPTNEVEEETDENEDPETVDKDLAFDEQIEDTIMLEGMEEPMTLNLYNPQDALFLTYVPEDLLAEEVSGGEGNAYYFYANYENEKLEDIYLQIYLFSENVSKQPSADDEDSTYAVAVENMNRVEENTYYDWAIEEYMSPEGSRIVALGEHEMNYFMVVVNSSVEYSEGFVPRANKIIEHLYWLDTEEYLIEQE